MYGESPIGKKVNLLKSVGSCTRTMTDETAIIVKVVPWSQELNDWCEHYIVRKENGDEVEIREVECVFSPDNEKPADHKAHDFLRVNGVYADVWPMFGGDNFLTVYISWGDWKHDHLWARTLMQYLGYHEMGSKVTEENGSDTYSAEHYFIKTSE